MSTLPTLCITEKLDCCHPHEQIVKSTPRPQTESEENNIGEQVGAPPLLLELPVLGNAGSCKTYSSSVCLSVQVVSYETKDLFSMNKYIWLTLSIKVIGLRSRSIKNDSN